MPRKLTAIGRVREQLKEAKKISDMRYRLYLDERRKVDALVEEVEALQRDNRKLTAEDADLRRQRDQAQLREMKLKGFVEGMLHGMSGKSKLPKVAKLPWNTRTTGSPR